MTLIDLTFGIATVAVAAIIYFAVTDERLRNIALALLAIVTAGYLGRAFWRGDSDDEPEPDSTPPPPDTTVDELDDAIDFEVIDETHDPLDPDDYPDDDPAVVDQLSQWADDV